MMKLEDLVKKSMKLKLIRLSLRNKVDKNIESFFAIEKKCIKTNKINYKHQIKKIFIILLYRFKFCEEKY